LLVCGEGGDARSAASLQRGLRLMEDGLALAGLSSDRHRGIPRPMCPDGDALSVRWGSQAAHKADLRGCPFGAWDCGCRRSAFLPVASGGVFPDRRWLVRMRMSKDFFLSLISVGVFVQSCKDVSLWVVLEAFLRVLYCSLFL
jgi:hypothetical protein